MPIRVLLLDPDPELARVARDHLERSGVEVHVLPQTAFVLADFEKIRPDVVLVDVSLPDLEGLTLSRKLRERTDTPLILLSAGDARHLCVRALDEGADDVIAKPFALDELLARIRARVRRARGEVVATASRIQIGALVIDVANRAVTFADRPIHLTAMELAVLTTLASRAGKPVSREAILEAVHGSEDTAFDRSIDVSVSRLRGKLEVDPRSPQLIKTVRRGGYMLALPT